MYEQYLRQQEDQENHPLAVISWCLGCHKRIIRLKGGFLFNQ